MLKRSITCFLFLALSISLVVGLPAAAAEKTKVRLGISGKTASFNSLIAHLKTSDTYSFQAVEYPNYDDLYEGFKANEVDLALVGAVKYVEAHFETGAMPVIAEGGMVRSMIVVTKDSPVTSTKDLVGLKFGMGYEGSTSTHLIPLLLLSKSRITEEDLGASIFLGSDQDKIVADVLSGAVDAAAIVEPVFERFKDEVRAVETSDPFPGGPVIARKDADPMLIEAVRKVFLSYKPVPGERFSNGAIAVTNDDFNQIRFLCKVVLGKSYI